MIFKSTSYEWLVVSESKAQYKGMGTINAAGSFEFMLIVLDEQGEGNLRIKKLRMRIWDKKTGRTIYDNALGYPDNIAPPTEVSGGTVDIQTK